MVDINRYMTDEDREALRRLAGMEHELSGGPGGPSSPVDAPGSKPMGPPSYAESQGYTARPEGPGERTAVQPHARGQDLDAPSPDAGGAGGFGNEFQEPDFPSADGTSRPTAAGLGAPQGPRRDPIAEARERGDDAYEQNMILAGIAQLFGGGGGAAQRARQRAETFRREPVQDARRQAQQDFRRRMAEEKLGLRKQQVEGQQQARQAKAQAQQMEAQREQAMRDPSSDMSRRAQQAVKKMFGDAIPDAVLQQMSAEELQSSGNPVMAAAKKAQSMRLKQQQFEDKREAKLEDYKKKRKLAFPYDMKLARAKAAMDQSEFAQELEARTETRKEIEEMKEEQRRERATRDEVTEYAKLATKTELPSQKRLVKDTINLAQEMKEETGEIFKPGDEVLRRMPTAMRGLMSEKASALQQKIDQLMNMTLKDRSGAAVTAQEFRRLQAELGQAMTGTEEQLMNALQNTLEYIEGRHQDLMGGFRPEVMQQYRRNREAAAGGGGVAAQPAPDGEPEEAQQSSAQPQREPQNDRVVVTVITPDGQTMRRRVPRGQLETVRKRAEAAGAQVEVQ